MKYPEAATPYTASYLLIRQAEKIAFVLRENTPWMNGYWGLPSGRVDKEGENSSESFTACAIHEGNEEVGITIKKGDLKHLLTMHRIEAGQNMVWVDLFFEVCEWSGQLHNAEPHKHAALDFFALASLPEKVVPSVRFALEAIEAGKTYVEYGWEETSA